MDSWMGKTLDKTVMDKWMDEKNDKIIDRWMDDEWMDG